ncbi:MAG: energy transducer TonB [Candidatus Cryptobacteroides sp.]|nr:energy transducer TonB [Bacteroidales bacterium]MDY6158242.1 energy transducer TonB [Candidatus Cryptobacteroides sp.]
MKLSKEDKAGLYLTVIVHLAVLIVLLLYGIGYSLSRENTFVLDFSRQEEIERMQEEIQRLQKEAELKESIAQKLQQELGGSQSSDIRNVAVDRAALRDDRGTDAEKLYKDAERLAKELNQGYEVPNEENSAVLTKKNDTASHTDTQDRKYSGPSVISYELEGRKASTLPIPAYRCYGAGEVKVLISVNPSGTVISAKVDEASSSEDSCLRSFAVRAARLSKFSAKSDAPAKQSGYIIYSFVAQ